MNKYRKEISQDEFEQIEKYLLNNMDVSERVEFERLLSADKVLRDEVTLQGRLMSAVETGAFSAGGVTDQQGKTAPTIRKLAPYWRYVAVAVVVFGAGLTEWWFYNQQMIPNEDLYATYFRPDAGLPVVMSGDTVMYVFNEGMILYKEKKYEDAIGVWEKLMAQKGITDTLQYYIGASWLNMDNLPKAEPRLKLISENTNSAFQQKATWYLALVKLKENDHDGARVLLEQLPDREEAAQLLEEITEK